jgi:hypothetical protein
MYHLTSKKAIITPENTKGKSSPDMALWTWTRTMSQNFYNLKKKKMPGTGGSCL